MSEEKLQNQRIAERSVVKTKIEFYVDSDIIEALSVDASETGIQLVTETPIVIRFRFKSKGKETGKSAELVWARKQPDGTQAYGFKFMPDLRDYR